MRVTWVLLAITALSVLVLLCLGKQNNVETFEVNLDSDQFKEVINAFFDVTGDNPTEKQLEEISNLLENGSLEEDQIPEKVKEIAKRDGSGLPDFDDMGNKVSDIPKEIDTDGDGIPDTIDPGPKGTSESEFISIGEADWNFGKLGFTTITVPYKLTFPSKDEGVAEADESSVMSVTVVAPSRSTVLTEVMVGDVGAQKALTSDPNRFEFLVKHDAEGTISFTQSEEQMSFSVIVGYRGESSSAEFKAPDDTFPPDDANSPNVVFGKPRRVERRIRIPFKILPRENSAADDIGETIRIMWRAPSKTTFFNRVEFSGQDGAAESVSVGHNIWDTTLVGNSNIGVVELQQTPGENGAPAFTMWLKYNDYITAIHVPKDTIRSQDIISKTPPYPPSITPLTKLSEDMVDLDAYPFQQMEPIVTNVVSTSPRIVWDISTYEQSSPGSMGYVIKVPLFLKFLENEVPTPSTFRLRFDLDPATTILRHIEHADKMYTPPKTMTNQDTFEADIEPPTVNTQKVVAVFDQPSGRRAFGLEAEYVGERTKVLLSGDNSVPKGTGFIGSKRPIDFQNQPQPRFTDVHETAEHRVKAVYKAKTGKFPDEQTLEFLMSKFFESEGDMKRINNLVVTITTVAESEDDEAAAVKKAIASMEAGASPGEAKVALKNWKEFETHKAMWRPDENDRRGAAGATALKRPWGEEAQILAAGFKGERMPSVASNPGRSFQVAPGSSESIMGQADWMFDSGDDVVRLN
ncbi:hypothetical protein TetV_294 [Tetraselmis virus 1]|uniref:Uncharacterized protein n=1 Tax=Tetraselmis virus 1 TaxID=2060617 RepID=A0A2P0VNA2_9VIRU|nr:hypothetical protein QJ968_gp294 [Tetraselmis virus 1]AUF82386.1 hypothetical protein TetV_294 [Tetraselmis virus 1]